MSENKNWMVGTESGHNPHIIFEGDEGIAEVFGLPMHSHISELNKEWHVEPLAKARIIAAAPDLLEALKDLARSLSDSDEDGLTEFADVMVAARSAIAKAEGRS